MPHGAAQTHTHKRHGIGSLERCGHPKTAVLIAGSFERCGHPKTAVLVAPASGQVQE